MILLASVFFVIREELPEEIHASCTKTLRVGYWLANGSLAVFFTALILAGIGKGAYDGSSFQEMMFGIRPYLFAFTLSGITLMIGFGSSSGTGFNYWARRWPRQPQRHSRVMRWLKPDY